MPFLVLRAGTLAESDTFWETRAGLLMLHTHALPRVDPFSWTFHGHAWTLNSWGFDVVVGLAYRVGGLPAVATAAAALVFLVILAMLRLARSLGARPGIATAVLVAGLALLTTFASARPQVVDYLAVLILVGLLRRIFGEPDARRSIASIGALSLVWVNLHAAASIGVGITAAVATVVALQPATRHRAVRFAAATGAAAGGALVNPYGFGIIHQTFAVRSASMQMIAEWQRFDPRNLVELLMMSFGIAAGVVAIRHRDPVLTGVVVTLVAGSIAAMRILPMLLVVAVPIIAAAASDGAVARYVESRRGMLLQGATVLVLASWVLAFPAMRNVGRPDRMRYPMRAVAALPSGCHVVNTYDVGGLLILERPDVQVSIDSRNDMYDVAGVVANERLLAAQGDVDHALAGAGCALLPPTSPLARRLGSDPAWRDVTAEKTAVLFVRR